MKTLMPVLAFAAAVVLLRAAEIDPSLGIADAGGTNVWYDGTLLAIEGKGWTNVAAYYDRLPADAQSNVTAAVWGLSHDSAGMCLRFSTDASRIQVRWSVLKANLAMPHMPATGVSGVDLYGRDESGVWRFVGNGRPTAVSNCAAFGVKAGADHVLYLPLYNGIQSIQIGIPGGRILSSPGKSDGPRGRPVLFYGTSITQGGCASRPGLATPAIVGRELDVPVINLGFSGSGRMEPAMAKLLAELDPSVYVLDCLWNMDAALVSERVEPFVRELRKARPDTPILLAEDSSVRNVTPTEKGRILRSIHEKLVNEGMKGLHFLSNADMLGNDGEGTVDGTHPNDLGMMRQAAVFVKALRPLLPAAGR